MAGPSEMKRFLRERRRAPLRDIAIHFETSEDNARAMIEPWLVKGKARRLATACCSSGGCGGCHSASPPEVYEWIEGVA